MSSNEDHDEALRQRIAERFRYVLRHSRSASPEEWFGPGTVAGFVDFARIPSVESIRAQALTYFPKFGYTVEDPTATPMIWLDASGKRYEMRHSDHRCAIAPVS